MELKIHNILPNTEVNGPGKRFAFWLQGCDRNCKNCFNPETHSFEGGNNVSVDDLYKQILSQKNIEGISISGGEPFYQSECLLLLLEKIKKETKLSVLAFTGFTLKELHNNQSYTKLLNYIDIIIAGPYDESKKNNHTLLSSTNQQLHFLSDKYTFNNINTNNCEIIIDKQGNVTLTGTAKI